MGRRQRHGPVHPVQGRRLQGPLKVAIPGGAPTGTVSNTNAADFHGDLFLFDSEAGVISGWRGALGTTAEIGNDDHAGDAVYKGLAIGTADVGKGMATYLYATDFHNGRIDVFDNAFASQTWPGAFVDPKLPEGLRPVRHPEPQGPALRDLREDAAGQRRRARRPGPRRRRRLPDRRHVLRPRRPGRRAERAVGPGLGARRLRSLQRRPHRRQLRRRRAPRLSPGTAAAGIRTATCGGRTTRPVVVDGLWGIAFGGGPSTTARRTRCSSPPVPTTKPVVPSARSTRRTDRRQSGDGGAIRSSRRLPALRSRVARPSRRATRRPIRRGHPASPRSPRAPRPRRVDLHDAPAILGSATRSAPRRPGRARGPERGPAWRA